MPRIAETSRASAMRSTASAVSLQLVQQIAQPVTLGFEGINAQQ